MVDGGPQNGYRIYFISNDRISKKIIMKLHVFLYYCIFTVIFVNLTFSKNFNSTAFSVKNNEDPTKIFQPDVFYKKSSGWINVLLFLIYNWYDVSVHEMFS